MLINPLVRMLLLAGARALAGLSVLAVPIRFRNTQRVRVIVRNTPYTGS